MPFEIQPLTKYDGPTAAHLVASSYSSNPFQKIIYPNGHNDSTMAKLAESRIKAIDDPDSHALKVVDTDTGEMAAVAVWAHTKAMSDEDWEHERAHLTERYPDARNDIGEEFLLKEWEAKRKIMGNTRWWGRWPFANDRSGLWV